MNFLCLYLRRDIHWCYIELELQRRNFLTNIFDCTHCSLFFEFATMHIDHEINFLCLAVALYPAYIQFGFAMELYSDSTICLSFNAANLLALLFDSEGDFLLIDAWNAVADVNFLPSRK